MKYKELLQKRADLVAEGRQLFERADAEGRGLTDDEKARDDAINATLEQMRADIERHEVRRERELAVAGVPDANQQAVRVSQMRDRAEDDPNRGFASIGDFALAVHGASRVGGYVDQRLRYGAAPTGYMETGGTSGEGYEVPPAMRQEMFDLVFNGTDVLGLVDPEPTNSNSVEMIADESTPWGATGVQSYWRTEGAQMTASKLDTDARQVRLHELYAFVLATEELLADGPRLTARLNRRAPEAIRYKASDAIVNGTGSGQPLGYLNASALVTVSKESGQSADTVVAANVAKMYARQINPGRSVWLINQDVLPQMFTMTLGDQPIWTPPATGFANAPGGFLFGRPVLFSEHNPTLGDAGDIQFIDPMGYYAVTRQGQQPDYAESIHLYFDYGVKAFRWTFRFGGQPFLSAAVSPAKGSSTRSHFVTLAARA